MLLLSLLFSCYVILLVAEMVDSLLYGASDWERHTTQERKSEEKNSKMSMKNR